MRRLFNSFRYAFAGIGYAVRTQANLRIHGIISIAVIVVGLWLRISNTEWAIIVVTMMMVLSAELFNTAIEAVIDRIGPEAHPLSKTTKDAAAGAVLIGAIGAVIVGILIFLPKLLALMGTR
jgi:diacylglycerol kinase (ATP)